MKKLFLLCSLFMATVQMWSIDIVESAGWLESAYIKWAPIDGAESYNVYYSGEGITDKIIDTQLIRSYGTYFRADVLGLKAGKYTITVKAVNVKDEEFDSVTSSEVSVAAHDRIGYAHAASSPKKTASGAYNDDGTLKAGAEVIYVTANNAKDLDVYNNYLKPREKKDNPLNPLAIRFIGVLRASDFPSKNINSAGLLQLKGAAETYEQKVTIEGVGDDTYLEFGLDIVKCSNVEVRNLGFKYFNEDAISVQNNNTNIWIHNNDLFYGQDKGGDKSKGDGATDIKDSQWCTVAYNHYWDSGKANLFGNGEDKIDYVSYHHNFFDHSDSRHPRVRCAQRMHVYNNYFKGVGKYCVGAAKKSSIFVENNYFENSKNPMLSSKQGSDILDHPKGTGTFSGEDGGIIKSYNNKIVNLKGSYRKWEASGEQNVEFDAYEVVNRTDEVPSSVQAKQGGATYSNFDQNLGYIPQLDTPDDAKANVEKYAGRVNGGDLKITFSDGDHTKTDDPDPAIANVLKAYKSKLVAIQGEDSPVGGGGDGEEPGEGGGEVPQGGYQFVMDKGINTSNYFIVTGSSSTNGKTQMFGDVSLATGLKMDSKGSITFTTTANNAILTIGMVGKEAAADLQILLGSTVVEPSLGVTTTFAEKKFVLAEKGTYLIKQTSKESYIYYVVVEDTPTAVGIDNTSDDDNSIVLYPNPVVNELHVNSAANIKEVLIYTVSGQLIRQVGSDVNSIDVSDLDKGSYIVNIRTLQGLYKQIVIKK